MLVKSWIFKWTLVDMGVFRSAEVIEVQINLCGGIGLDIVTIGLAVRLALVVCVALMVEARIQGYELALIVN